MEEVKKVEMAGDVVQVVRILIVFFSWAILVPTPSSSVDFFRTLVIFTMSMTYDWWNEVNKARKDNRQIHKWFYYFSVGYSVLWLIVSFSGMFSLANLDGALQENVKVFPGTELEFEFPRINMVISMLGYPFISLIEKMVPAQLKRNSEEATV